MEKWDRIVTPHFADVVATLQPSLLLNQLRQKNLIAGQELTKLRTLTEHEQAQYLVNDLLPRKGKDSLDIFCDILLNTKGQEHIVTEILKYKPTTQQNDEKCTDKDPFDASGSEAKQQENSRSTSEAMTKYGTGEKAHLEATGSDTYDHSGMSQSNPVQGVDKRSGRKRVRSLDAHDSKRVRKEQTEAQPEDKIDVLIVTAVSTEFKAVKEVLKNVSGQALKSSPIRYFKESSIKHCEVATWKPNQEQRSLVVGVVKQRKQGAAETENIVQIIRDAFDRGRIVKNGLVAMVGVCAGNKFQKVKLGDVMVPHEIAPVGDGGKLTSQSFQQDSKIASLSLHLTNAIQVAASTDTTEWLGYLPNEYRGAPSPRYLFDATLFALKAERDATSADELLKQLTEQYQWPTTLVTKTTVKEALGHLHKSEYVAVVGGRRRRFQINKNGKKRIKDKTQFPRPDSVPTVHDDATLMGHIVNTALNTKEDWAVLKSQSCKRSAAAYEMEGYTFLDKMHTWCPELVPVFIKSVADFGTEKYKMGDKYYQVYTSAVAAAFLFHFLATTEPDNRQK